MRCKECTDGDKSYCSGKCPYEKKERTDFFYRLWKWIGGKG